MPPQPQTHPLMAIPAGECAFQVVAGITENWAKEDVSIAYLAGMVAQVGLQFCDHPLHHDDGIDVQVGASDPVVPGIERRNPRVLLQMKATSVPEINGNTIVYRFTKRDSYENLRKESTIPQALVVYIMPADRQKWLISCDDHTDFAGHAFYFDMADAPALGANDPPKIIIPFANRLTPRSFLNFFNTSVQNYWQRIFAGAV